MRVSFPLFKWHMKISLLFGITVVEKIHQHKARPQVVGEATVSIQRLMSWWKKKFAFTLGKMDVIQYRLDRRERYDTGSPFLRMHAQLQLNHGPSNMPSPIVLGLVRLTAIPQFCQLNPIYPLNHRAYTARRCETTIFGRSFLRSKQPPALDSSCSVFEINSLRHIAVTPAYPLSVQGT